MNTSIKRMRQWIEKHANVRIFLIIVLLFLCAFELEAIVREFRSTYVPAEAYLTYHHGQIQRTPNISTPSDIQSWMTFGYVNFVFKLPASYLQTALHITDPQYPNIQIRRYAREKSLDLTQLTTNVQQAVTAYGH